MSSREAKGSNELDAVSSSRPGDPATRRRILDAALELIVEKRGGPVMLADVARRAQVSRQAIYLHFAGRTELFVGVARYADELRGLDAELQRIVDAEDGIAALLEVVAVQARIVPQIWPVARALDAVRRQDEAAEESWQDRMENRYRGCRAVVERLRREGTLRKGLDATIATDLLWALTSLRTWEDLVLERGWSPQRYQRHLSELLLAGLVEPRSGSD